MHSQLQHDGGGWESFHSAHITHLTDALDAILPEAYFALNEKSLQLSFIDPQTGVERRSPTRPDIGIYGGEGASSEVAPSDAPTVAIPLLETLIEDDPLRSVLIVNTDQQPVTRIELLSPANKPNGSHHVQYLIKRSKALMNGINLIELDYLHETRPIIRHVPSYADGEANAYPYLITISDPHPTLEDSWVSVYGIEVDQRLPILSLPLAGADRIVVDFDAPYQVTFSRNRYYGLVLVDYEQPPARFETYSARDQQRIRAVMQRAGG